MYGYEAFAANFVSRGIVVVTVQYRLGAFGKMHNYFVKFRYFLIYLLAHFPYFHCKK